VAASPQRLSPPFLCPARTRRGRIPPLRMGARECGAVALGRACLFPPLLSGGALVAQPWLRFHPPLLSGGALVAQPWLRFHTPLICSS
jgi:hypothetical protein